MRRAFPIVLAVLLVLTAALPAVPAFLQLLPQEIANEAQWEEFLRAAEVVGETQMGGPDAVTRPWKLTLEKDGRSRIGLWKDIDGRDGDIRDCWRYEIAAYRLDRLLGLNMVPVTVERSYKDKQGSLQLWMDDTPTIKALGPKIAERTRGRSLEWNRAAYVQRIFDDLLANEDRNANNILVTLDGRMILIDHSRTFRTARRYLRNLIFGPDGLLKAPDGSPILIKTLPRAFVEKIRALDGAGIRAVAGTYLNEEEIKAVLARKSLVLREIDALIARNGEAQVLY